MRIYFGAKICEIDFTKSATNVNHFVQIVARELVGPDDTPSETSTGKSDIIIIIIIIY